MGKTQAIIIFSMLACTAPLEARAQDKDSKPISSPIHASKIAFEVSERDLIAEGLAYDRVEDRFYLSSIFKRKIVRVEKSGKHADFTSTAQDGLFQVLGMKVDAERRILWACSEVESNDKETDGYSGIFKYDLTTGKLIKKYVVDNKTGPHLFNDLVIHSARDIFFTDSRAGCVYTINHPRDVIEPFTEPKSFIYPNGIALSSDERHLFVADAKGIAVLDPKSAKRTQLTPSQNEEIRGMDGLYYYANSLIGIQNAPRLERVVRLFLNADLTTVERVEVLDQNNPLFNIPTTGTIVGDEFYFIGNSQLDRLKDDGTLSAPEKLEAVRILKLKL
jgi:hypothetical protein